jgi:predicted methyltransferase
MKISFLLAMLVAVVTSGCVNAPPTTPGERAAAIVANPDRTAADRENDAAPPPAFAERQKNPQLAHMQFVRRPFEDPVPPEFKGKLDLVTLMFNYHDMGHLHVDRAKLNRSVFDGLKPGGMYVIADHSGRAGTGISESGTLHRIEETFLVKEVEAAGFKLVARGDFLANPQDPRDQAEPPFHKDEFVLKFVKP